MHGHPLRPLRRRAPARVLARRLLERLTLGPLGGELEALGALGLERGQRVLVYGEWLARWLLEPTRSLGATRDLAVSGDVLGFAEAWAARVGARWVPTVQGPAAAELSLGHTTWRLGALRGGVLSFLGSRSFTLDGVGFDLTEPGEILDAWGGLDDMTRRRLVPSGDRRVAQDPAALLRGLALELDLSLDPSPRLTSAQTRLVEPARLRGLTPEVFWDLLDPFLAPGRAAAWKDGRLGACLSAYLASRRLPVVAAAADDAPLLQALDRLEAELGQSQTRELGLRRGAGLASAARLVAMLDARLPGAWPVGLGARLGRPRAAAEALSAVRELAADLAAEGFPDHVPPRRPGNPARQGAAALLAAARASMVRDLGDVARVRPEPGRQLVRYLGIRIPRAA